MDFSVFSLKLKNVFSKKIGLDLDDSQCHSFFDYMNLLVEKNKVMNLTAITDPDEIIVRHFLDSCMILKFLKPDEFLDRSFVDIGTGAGFPGLPLAIACPSSKFNLTDTLGKRINFLDEVVKALNLKNVKLVKARAEDFCHDSLYREKFDFCLSRGVAKISVLSEYSLPSVKVGGQMLAWKMDDCDTELNEGTNAIVKLGGMFHVKHSYSIIESDPNRCILEIKKVKTTPNQYPRQAGFPSKKPL